MGGAWPAPPLEPAAGALPPEPAAGALPPAPAADGGGGVTLTVLPPLPAATVADCPPIPAAETDGVPAVVIETGGGTLPALPAADWPCSTPEPPQPTLHTASTRAERAIHDLMKPPRQLYDSVPPDASASAEVAGYTAPDASPHCQLAATCGVAAASCQSGLVRRVERAAEATADSWARSFGVSSGRSGSVRGAGSSGREACVGGRV